MRRRAIGVSVGSVWENRDDGHPRWSADTRPSRAVSRNKNIGTTSVTGVRRDRFDHQVEFIDAIDLTRHVLRLIRRNEQGCDEVAQTINALGVAVLHQGRRARPILRPGELDYLAQARS
jgi:hypothetical protein